MSENAENRKLINFLLVSIVVVGMLVCALFIYRTLFTDTLSPEDEVNKIVEEKTNPDKPINKYNTAILHYTNYTYSPYRLLREKNVLTSEDFSTLDAINFVLGFENNQDVSNVLNKVNSLFGKSISETDITTEPRINVYNGKLDLDTSSDSYDLVIHYIYDSKEEGNKLVFSEYCAYQAHSLDNPEVNYYYNFRFTPDENGRPANTDEAILMTDSSSQAFNIIDNKERVSDLEWTFEKLGDGSYKLISIELKN